MIDDQAGIPQKQYDPKDVKEAVVIIFMPMLKRLHTTDHKCPCYPDELGLCPCTPFIEKLECKCGLFILLEFYKHENGKVQRVKIHA